MGRPVRKLHVVYIGDGGLKESVDMKIGERTIWGITGKADSIVFDH
jgi:hypothetical protein